MTHPGTEAAQASTPTAKAEELLRLRREAAGRSKLASAGVELAQLVREAALCSCEVVEDGDAENGPHLSISELDPECGDPEHRAAWREGQEEQRGYELSLLCSSIEAVALGYERAADSVEEYGGSAIRVQLRAQASAVREALELVRSTDAGRALAEAESSWEEQQEASNR